MTNEELQNKLAYLKENLEKSHKKKDIEKVDYYVRKINDLWNEASVEMLKNAEEAGLYTPDKS